MPWDTSKAMQESTAVVFKPLSLGQVIISGLGYPHRQEREAGPHVETIGFHRSGKRLLPLSAVDQRQEP